MVLIGNNAIVILNYLTHYLTVFPIVLILFVILYVST